VHEGYGDHSAPIGARPSRIIVLHILFRRRRITAHQWWAYFGAFGDDCFEGSDDDLSAA
jgi:hypothetical protein